MLAKVRNIRLGATSCLSNYIIHFDKSRSRLIDLIIDVKQVEDDPDFYECSLYGGYYFYKDWLDFNIKTNRSYRE
jgi:predicted component of type VI protein secretion system